MKKPLELAELIFTVISLIFYTGGPLVVILSGGISEGEAGGTLTPDFALIKILFQINYVISLCLILPRWHKGLYLLAKDGLIAALMVVIVLSILWSSAPEMTINRSVAIIGTTLFGVYLATRYSLRQQLNLLGWAFGIAIVLSVLFAVALPTYGIMGGTHAGAWRGMYNHKNMLGGMMALSAMTFFLLALGTKQRKWLLWGGFGASIALMLLSRASSPLINLFVVLNALWLFRILRWHHILKSFMLGFVVMLGGAAVLSIAPITEMLLKNTVGKDLTFTGRTDVWLYVWDMIWQRPWLGYGYGALWVDWGSETGKIWWALMWEAPNSHNGFLELWLGLGALGLSVFCLHFLINFFRMSALVSQSRTSEYFLPLIILLITILANLTESTLLDRNSIYWVLYVSLSLSSRVKTQSISPSRMSAPTLPSYLEADRAALP
jgi:exopolysaccharide production protein ExoQ